jgi:hypothetical protein
MTLVQIMRLFLFVREVGGPNKGVWVGLFQSYTGNKAGDSWCASFLCFCLSIFYKGLSPFAKTASCDVLREQMIRLAKRVRAPQPGDVFFYMNGTDAHHVGVVAEIRAVNGATDEMVIGIAGNTSKDGRSSNGDGVYEHAIVTAPGKIEYYRLP